MYIRCMSKRFVFPYEQFEGEAASAAFPNGRAAYRPILPVSLSAGDRHFSCKAIVDSGADYCTFPGAFMNALGIEKLAKPDPNFRGPTGAGHIWFCEVTIDLEFAAPYSVYASFSDGLNDWFINDVGVGLLGQVGFFDQFKVAFDWTSKCFAVETRDGQE
jgi:hypothetical protein